MSKYYLFDTNTFITPFNSYYSFDLAPNFWAGIKDKIEDGTIPVLDKVYDELIKGNDDKPRNDKSKDDKLRKWLLSLDIRNKVVHKTPSIITKYSEILGYIQTSGLYKPKALTEWSNIQVADPWLIAAACVNQYAIVTFETPNGNLSPTSPSARPKIPDISKVFGVECTGLFEVMRRLSIKI
ncbi:MAG: DUF4411 family protein [Gracilibacteraceae bacterium]|jgi:hypothetical protein|nr:DUF4411 family protein [Gracilibacteraceae bacterium]